MKDANEPSAMNANNYGAAKAWAINALWCLCGFVFATGVNLALLMPAQAQNSAPAMFGVKEILVQYPHINNPEAGKFCGLTNSDLLQGIVKNMKANGLPVITPMEALPPSEDIARIEVWPEIFTLNNEGIDCTSWVSLSIKSEHTLLVPPIKFPRSVVIEYWAKGGLVTSSESQHQRTVIAAFNRLGDEFAVQFQSDQPAAERGLRK